MGDEGEFPDWGMYPYDEDLPREEIIKSKDSAPGQNNRGSFERVIDNSFLFGSISLASIGVGIVSG